MRRLLWMFGSCLLAGSALGCGGTSSPSANTAAFSGIWACTINVVGGNSSTNTFAVVDNHDGTITATSTSGTACIIKFTVSGNNATPENGQTCGSSGAAFTGGQLTVNGSNLSGTLTASQTVSGVMVSAMETFMCSKQ